MQINDAAVPFWIIHHQKAVSGLSFSDFDWILAVLFFSIGKDSTEAAPHR